MDWTGFAVILANFQLLTILSATVCWRWVRRGWKRYQKCHSDAKTVKMLQ